MDLEKNNSSGLVGVAVSLLVLTHLCVLLRSYARAMLTKNFQMDDWLMIVSQVIFTVSCVFILLGVKHGLGHHNNALEQDEEIKAIKWQALATATYILDMMFIKLSYAVFLLRLAQYNRYRWALWASMIIVGIWSTVLFFWDMFQCTPVQAQWDYTIPGSKCVSTQQVVSAAYALSVMSITTDWFYALLPIAMIRGIQMTKQAKAIVIVLLGLGIFASVATLIRLKFLSDLNDTADILFAGTNAMIWTLVEPGVAIIASSLVTIRPLLHAMHVNGFSSCHDEEVRRHDNNRPRSRAYGAPQRPNDDILLEMALQHSAGESSTEYSAASTSANSVQKPPAVMMAAFLGRQGRLMSTHMVA